MFPGRSKARGIKPSMVIKKKCADPFLVRALRRNVRRSHRNIVGRVRTRSTSSLLNKKIEWVGKEDGLKCDGWYYRDIHGHKKLKLLIGKPKTK